MTVPLGVPAAPVVTVAVKVTASPTFEGLSDEVTAVVVAFLFTSWLNTAEVLAAKLASPPYTAVIACVPAVRAEVV